MRYPDNEIEIFRMGRPWAVRYMRFGRRWLRVLKGTKADRVMVVDRNHVRRTVRKYRGLNNYRVEVR